MFPLPNWAAPCSLFPRSGRCGCEGHSDLSGITERWQKKLKNTVPRCTWYKAWAPLWVATAYRYPDRATRLGDGFNVDTLTNSLSGDLGLEGVSEDELYRAMDWLLDRQPAIETALAKRHFGGRAAGTVRSDVDLLRRAALLAGQAGALS
jgi:hypothetical protein